MELNKDKFFKDWEAWLKENKVKKMEFYERIQYTPEYVQMVKRGKRELTEDLAYDMSRVMLTWYQPEASQVAPVQNQLRSKAELKNDLIVANEWNQHNGSPRWVAAFNAYKQATGDNTVNLRGCGPCYSKVKQWLKL